MFFPFGDGHAKFNYSVCQVRVYVYLRDRDRERGRERETKKSAYVNKCLIKADGHFHNLDFMISVKLNLL